MGLALGLGKSSPVAGNCLPHVLPVPAHPTPIQGKREEVVLNLCAVMRRIIIIQRSFK